ncbi:hypothetical protein ULG90_25095 [Halopseudomonas pachastrellae]|nr:hypothetical protein ULG90_25095 [Halopseudomonas pachastrellae]
MTDNQPLSSNNTQVLKAQQRREKFAELLREMFQLNQPELDFGLYRIMHARKDDVNRFIEQDLPRITRDAFASFASSDKAELQKELELARKAATDAGFEPEASPKVQSLQAQLKDGFDLAREEGEVYDALVTFLVAITTKGIFCPGGSTKTALTPSHTKGKRWCCTGPIKISTTSKAAKPCATTPSD